MNLILQLFTISKFTILLLFQFYLLFIVLCSTQSQLPAYAVPLFVRIQPEIEITSTFKHKKADLKKEGFNPSVISDKLYFRDSEQAKYIPLDSNLFNDIVSGNRARL